MDEGMRADEAKVRFQGDPGEMPPIAPKSTVEIQRESWVDPRFGDEIEGIVRKWSWLIPNWVTSIKLSQDSGVATAAEIRVNYSYRTATFVIGNEWMHHEPKPAEHIVVHELCHLYTVPLVEHARETLNACFPDESNAGYKIAWSAITGRMEAMTEDLCQTLLRALK